MRPYDRNKALIFIHVPKCAGTSINLVLKKWFGDNYLRHGFNKHNTGFRSSPYELKPGTCISGHFSRLGDESVRVLYPEADQFITFLRDPFEIALSQYFFWKKKRRAILIKEGTLKKNSADDFKGITDFFKKRSKSVMLNFMPTELTLHNFKEMLDKHFIYTGIVEDLRVSMNKLAETLGYPGEEIAHRNKSERDERVPEEVKNKFINDNSLEYIIYNYILNEQH
jgi:hypothetical protein